MKPMKRPEKIHELLAAQDELQETFRTLSADVQVCISSLDQAQRRGDAHMVDFWKRSYCKSFFVLLEGNTFHMKQVALIASECFGVALSDEEIGKINEFVEVIEDGEPKRKNKFLKFKPNLIFSFQIYAKAHGGAYKLDLGRDDLGNLLKSSTNIRHRLTHPKSKADLIIPEETIHDFTRLYTWYKDSYLELAKIIMEAE